MLRGRWLLEAAKAVPDVDCYFAVEPDSAAIATKLAKANGAEAIFDIHEIYHDEMLKRWVPKLIRPLASMVVKSRMLSLCRRCDLSVGAGMTRIAPYKSSAQESMVVRHCLSRRAIGQIQAAPFAPGKPEIRIMHGKATLAHGTREVLEGAVMAQRVLGNKANLKVFCFDTYGSYDPFGYAAFEDLAKEVGAWPLVEMHAPVSFSEMLPILAGCDLGIIAYGREFGINCMPNRIFEYMAVGLPVIAPSYAIEMKTIIDRYNCGILVDTEQAGAIRDALVAMVTTPAEPQRMGAAGRLAVERELNMETEVAPLIEWIRRHCG